MGAGLYRLHHAGLSNHRFPRSRNTPAPPLQQGQNALAQLLRLMLRFDIGKTQ